MHVFRGLENPWRCHWFDEFQKIRTFFGKSCCWAFGAPGCHPSTLIDLVKTALASRGSVKTVCMFLEVYRTPGGVTGSMNFKKSGHFFSEKCAPGFFGAPDSHPGTLIDLVKIDLASKGSVETICMISESCRTHRGFTGPMNFKKVRTFFFRKIVLMGFWGPWLLSRHFN